MFDQMVSEILNKNLIEENNAKTIAAIVGLWASGLGLGDAQLGSFGGPGRPIPSNLRASGSNVNKYPISELLGPTQRVNSLDQISYGNFNKAQLENFIKEVKELEGFNPNPYWDGKHFSIGYGTYAKSRDWKKDDNSYDYVAKYESKLDADQLQQFRDHKPISTPNIKIIQQTEGDMTLRNELRDVTEIVREFIGRNNILEANKYLTYGQVFAMIDLRFNAGSKILQKLLVNPDTKPYDGKLINVKQLEQLLRSNDSGIQKRRTAEVGMYTDPNYPEDANKPNKQSVKIDNFKVPDNFEKRKFSIR